MPPTPVSSINADTSGSLNWWQAILLAASSALLGILSVVMAQSNAGGPPKPQVLFRYVPHFLLLFGLLADAFTYQGVYWTSTVVGLAGYFSSGILTTIIDGIVGLLSSAYGRATGAPASAAAAAPRIGTAVTQDGSYDGCTFQGGTVESMPVPPTLTASSSIMWYFIIDSIDNHGFASALGSIFAFMALYGAQVSSIKECITTFSSGAMWGLIYGLIVAGILYSIIKSVSPQYLPSSVVNAGGSGNPKADAAAAAAGLAGGATTSTLGTGSTPRGCTGASCP